MGSVKSYHPVKLIAAVTVQAEEQWPELQAALERLFAPLDMAMNWYDFHHTDYYTAEMGTSLKKRMISFQGLIDAERLPDIKLATNRLEESVADGGKRRVNIDPGYICAPRLVLATTKDYSHRVYLGKGIFADLHLLFLKGHFQPQPWTYPDYREPAVLGFFERVREQYMTELGLAASAPADKD